MTPAIMALVLALFAGTPVTVGQVEAAGASVTYVDETPVAGMAGWVGCSETACEIRLRDTRPEVLQHEAAHAVDALCDGKLDGAICGWQPWAGDPYYTSLGPVEGLAYYLGDKVQR